MEKLKKVNIFVGRFQPFHKGHLKCCEDIYKENGYPVVIFYITNKKFDKKKPFGDEFIENELEIIKNKVNYIEDKIWLRQPFPNLICNICLENGYEPVCWIAGEDRIDSYKRMIKPDHIKEEFGFDAPELILTNRYCSATQVRNAIKDNDYDTYKELMPDAVKNDRNMFDKLREAYMKVLNECKKGMIALSDFIKESL